MIATVPKSLGDVLDDDGDTDRLRQRGERRELVVGDMTQLIVR